MRVYTAKPRTNGFGYKGMVHNPSPNGPSDPFDGVIAARRLHIKVISETGVPTADEMLYPQLFRYFDDILAYAAVGARSVEDQACRQWSWNPDRNEEPDRREPFGDDKRNQGRPVGP